MKAKIKINYICPYSLYNKRVNKGDIYCESPIKGVYGCFKKDAILPVEIVSKWKRQLDISPTVYHYKNCLNIEKMIKKILKHNNFEIILPFDIKEKYIDYKNYFVKNRVKKSTNYNILVVNEL